MTLVNNMSQSSSSDAKLSWEPKRVCIVGSGELGMFLCSNICGWLCRSWIVFVMGR